MLKELKSRMCRLFKSMVPIGAGIGLLVLLGAGFALAQETPSAEETSQPSEAEVFLSNFDPAKSFSKLLLPYVAERVGLTDAQQTEVSRLMAERAKLLGQAQREQWPQIVQDNEAALKAILSPQQLERFDTSLAEKRIILRFSKERWEDVLKWLAAELGLQLVMDAPPPGTFNYSDKNEYSPKEALDVICGVLQTKGYTLFRSGEILYLHNFRSGPIPLQFLPKIKPEELPDQSRFDYVALTIPVERRSIATIQEAIRPFKGPYCTVRVLSGSSLMVVDSVNALREILPVVMGVYNPPIPAAAPESPSPAWRDFPLEKVKPALVQEQVAKFAPSAKPLMNPAANMISYLAIPSEHQVIDGIIQRLEEGQDPSKELTFRVYPLNKILGASEQELAAYARRLGYSMQSSPMILRQKEMAGEIISSIKSLAPDAQTTFNPITRQLIVVAAPADQEKIKTTIDQLQVPIEESEAILYKIYRFEDAGKTLSETELSTLRSMVPNADLKFDSTNKTLVLIGTSTEQEKIAQAVSGMNADYLAPENQQVFCVYPMTAKQLYKFNTLFTRLAEKPEMKGVIPIRDTSVNQLSIWATPRQQEQIKRIVDQIAGAYFVEAEKEQIDVPQPQGLPAIQEPISGDETAPAPAAEPAPAPAAEQPAEKAPAAETPAENAPAAETPAEKAPAAETPAENAPAAETPAENAPAAETPAAEQPAEPAAETDDAISVPGGLKGVYLTVIKLSKTYSTPLSVLLTNTIPGIEVTYDSETRSLVVYGTKSMITAARRAVEQLERGAEMVMESIPLTNTFPMETITAISRIEPTVTITRDMKNQQLFLFGRQEGVTRVKASIESILAKSPNEEPSVYYLDVTKDFPPATLDFIKRTVPKAEITYDEGTHRFTIFGTPTDQLTISKLITDSETNLPAREEVRYYTQEDRVSDQFIERIKTAVPNIPEIKRDDTNPRVLAVKARPAMQEEIAAVIERLKTEIPGQDENTLAFYTLEEEQYKRFETLRPGFEKENGAVNVVGYEDERLMVWALPWQQEKIKALIDQIQAGLSAEETKKTARLYTPKYVDAETLANVIRDIYPSVSITSDTVNNRLILNGTASRLEEAAAALAAVDVKETDGVQRTFAAYDVKMVTSYDKNGNAYSPLYLVRDLQRLVPAAKVSYEYYNQQIIVWGTEEEHAIIKEAIGNLNQQTSFSDRIYRHEIRRASYSTLVTVLAQIYPRAKISYDSTSNSIIIQGNNLVMDEVKELINILDPENPSPFDPTVAVYPFENVPSTAAVATLKELVPTARIEINTENRQLMVIARPAEQKILADNIKSIEGMMTEPDPVLAFYSYENEPSDSMLATLATLAPSAKIENLKLDKKLMVTAKPREQKIVSETLGLIASNSTTGDPTLKIYTFDSRPTEKMVETLKKFAPDADFDLDPASGRLTVVARPAELEKIDSQIQTLSASLTERNLKMVAYPIYGMDMTELKASFTKVYPDIKIELDTAGSRMLIWGTLDEQVKISEEIAQINGNQETEDGIGYAGPQVIVYEAESMSQGYMLQRLVTSMFPAAEIFPEWSSTVKPTITILASSRDHKKIADIFDQLKNPVNEEKKMLETYPIGELDPVTVETTILNILDNAVSGSPTEIRRAVTASPSRTSGKKPAFFRVDPKTKTVAVYATTEELDRVRDSMQKMTLTASNASKEISKVYRLASPIGFTLVVPLRQIIPAATVSASNMTEIIVFGTEDEIAKADLFMKGVQDHEGEETHYQFKTVSIPEGSLYSRDSIVEAINSQFLYEHGQAYPGAALNQIVLYGVNKALDKMTDYIKAAYETTEVESYKTYNINNLPLSTAAQLITELCPNTTVAANPDNHSLTILGTLFVHKKVEEVLAQIDAKRTGDNEFTVRYYGLDGLSIKSFYPIYSALYYYMTRQCPTSSLIVESDYYKYIVIATEQDQEKIARFFAEVKEKRLASEDYLEVYHLTSTHLGKVTPIIQTTVPRCAAFPGKRPNEIFIWGNSEDHEKIRAMLAKIESVEEGGPTGMIPKIYKVDAKGLTVSLSILTPSLPGAVMYPIASNRIIVWGSEADHRLASELIGAMAEAYPEQVLVRYSLTHLNVSDVYAFLYSKYITDAVIYPTSQGDLMVRASAEIQEKIAAEIKEFDVPRSEDAEPYARAYDIGKIPAVSHTTAVSNILRIVPEAVFLPTITPGYFVIYAKKKVQDKVANLVEQMLQEQPWLKARTERYLLKNTSVTEALPILRQLAPTASFTPAREWNQFFVYGNAEEQERIAEAVDKMNEEPADGIKTRIYRLDRASLVKAQSTIATLYPTRVACIIDPTTRTLTVNASEEYQKKVEELISELDRLDTETQPQVQVFNLSGVRYASIITPIRSFYATDPTFQVSYDPTYESLIVQGTPKQLTFVSNLISQVQQGGLSDPSLVFKTYTMRNPWSYYTISSVFARQGRELLMFQDYSTGKLIVMARPEEHTVIENLLDALAPEKTQLAIFDLVYVDPQTAYTIISTMLENDGSFVDIQFDSSSNRLYVRANAKKLEEIRRFLIGAGETGLEQMPPIEPKEPDAVEKAIRDKITVQGDGPLRTIKFDGDLRDILNEVQKNWKLKNPLNVIESGQNLIQTEQNPNGEPAPAQAVPEQTAPAQTAPEQAVPAQTAPEQATPEPAPAENTSEPVSQSARTIGNFALSLLSVLKPTAVLTANTESAAQNPDAAGVYVVLNEDGTLTITSSDIQALETFQEEFLSTIVRRAGLKQQAAEQVADAAQSAGIISSPAQIDKSNQEKNIRYLARQNTEAAREKLVMEDQNFSIYKVEQVSVDMLLTRLTFYMADRINPPKAAFAPSYASQAKGISMRTISTGPRLTFTPDRVLNTIMVKGSKADRDEAGAMIAVLDRPELFPQPITKPYKVPVKNMSVQKMAMHVLNAFQQKFISTRLPGNMAPRISPNTETSTLEIYAPDELAKEIAEYVQEMDEDILKDPNRNQVQIVKLKKINSAILQKYISDLRSSIPQYNYTTPYMFNPNTFRPAAVPPRQF